MHNSRHLLDPLAAAVPVLTAADFAIVNLETAVAPPSVGVPPVAKRFLFRSDPVIAEQLADAGIDAVALANNHALDFGPDALNFGLETLAAAGVKTVGAGADSASAYEPLVVGVGEWTVGIVSLSRVPCDWSWDGVNRRPQVAWACDPFMEQADAAVSQVVETTDLSVVMVHGGTEGQLCADQTMTDLNSHWAALGVDLVVNTHPHVVQGITSIEETVVVQSTGNFAFPPSTGLTANSAVFLATLSDAGLFLSVEPFVSEGGVLATGSAVRVQSILNQIDQYSSGWGVDGDGRVIPDSSWTGLCPG